MSITKPRKEKSWSKITFTFGAVFLLGMLTSFIFREQIDPRLVVSASFCVASGVVAGMFEVGVGFVKSGKYRLLVLSGFILAIVVSEALGLLFLD